MNVLNSVRAGGFEIDRRRPIVDAKRERLKGTEIPIRWGRRFKREAPLMFFFLLPIEGSSKENRVTSIINYKTIQSFR